MFSGIFAIVSGNRVVQMIGAGIMILLAIVTFGKIKKRQGRREERQEATDADRENADGIRDRVRDAGRVRPDREDNQFRD